MRTDNIFNTQPPLVNPELFGPTLLPILYMIWSLVAGVLMHSEKLVWFLDVYRSRSSGPVRYRVWPWQSTRKCSRQWLVNLDRNLGFVECAVSSLEGFLHGVLESTKLSHLFL